MTDHEFILMDAKIDGIASDVSEVKKDVKSVKETVNQHQAIVATIVWLGRIAVGTAVLLGGVAALAMVFK